MKDYYLALHKCAERYRDMLLDDSTVKPDDPLWLFTMEFMFGCRDELPIPKLCRWLGYIQGVLIERDYTTVQAERDWTRPLFQPLDFPPCEHDWVYQGTDRGGSHKGEDYYRCKKCNQGEYRD